MKEKGISEKLSQNNEIFYLCTHIFYWKLLTNSAVDVYESFDWRKFVKSLRFQISSYFSALLMLSPNSTDAIPPQYWIASTVLMLSHTILMLSPHVLMLSLHSTDAIPHSTEQPPQYWSYPSTVLMLSPHVLMLSPTVLQLSLHSTE